MARRSQCSSAGDNPLDPNYLHPHYREEYRLAIDALVESDLDGYHEFLQAADVVDFLSRLEIEHIQNTVQNPRHSNKPGAVDQGDDTSGEGSSDTYWPMLSDMDAPSLDLGWPQPLHFIGPTEITTFVNPPDPAMPSIKTQARRLIKDAQLVIAVVMDIFTDVDIFADLLEAAMRNVAVYILLDQQNAHHFAAMVANCRVNLEQVQSMRVRTVAGSTYRCRTGKSFQGQMMERFLLIDSRAVLGGNYSFMWSYEKLHRCLAHLFLGQLVVTFDEEFRILYAQSEPIVIEGVMVPIQKYSSMPELPKQYQVFPRVKPELPGNLYEGQVDVDARRFPLRRGESAHVLFPTQPNMFPLQQHRPGALDRHLLRGAPYGEGTSGAFYQQYLMHRERQTMDTLETQSTHSHRDQYHCERTGLEPAYDLFGKFRLQRYQHSDQYSEPGGPHMMDQVDNYDHMLKFLQSNPTAEVGPGPGPGPEVLVVPEGPYMSSRRRQRSGQPYACQTSPTPLSPHEQKRFYMEASGDERKSRDADAKKGMRDWRILSYLSAYEDSASEDAPPPQGSDMGDDSPFSSQERLCDPELSAPRISLREPPKMPSAVLPSRQKKLFQTDDMKNLPSLQTDFRAMSAATSESSSTSDGKRVEDGTDKPPAETNEDLFRKRPNPTLQRTSRLRNSLLFSSNQEQHRSLFDLARPAEPKQEENLESQEKSSEKTLLKQQSTAAVGVEQRPPELPFSQLQRTASFMVDMDDADCRLQFFRQLAAQRKVEAATKLAEGTSEKSCTEPGKTGSGAPDGSHKVRGQQQTSEVSHKSTDRPGDTDSQSSKATKDKIPIITLHVSDSDTKSVETLSMAEDVTSKASTAGRACGVLPQIATDAEKIERKRLQEPAVAKEASLGSDAKGKSLDSAHKPAKEESTAMPSVVTSESPSNIKPVLPVISGAAASKKTPAETKDPSSITSSDKAADGASSGAVQSSGTKQDVVEKRSKLALQRASKLRNSLLFRSRSEQQRPHSETFSLEKNVTDDRNQEEGGLSSAAVDPGSLDKVVKQSEDCVAPANPTAESVNTQDSAKGPNGRASEAKVEGISYKRQASFTMGDKYAPLEFQSKVLQRTTAMLDLSDPHSRLQLFRELAAQRKVVQAAVRSAESAAGHISQKPDEPKDTSATEEHAAAPHQSSTDPLSKPLLVGGTDPLSKPLLAGGTDALLKPLLAGGTNTKAEASHVLDDDAKTRKAQSAAEGCETTTGLSDNTSESGSSTSEFTQTATDVEKMELKKLRDEMPAKPPNTSLTSSAPTDTSSAPETTPKDVALTHQDRTSEKQISKSDKCALPNEHVPAASSLTGLSIRAGQLTHSPAVSRPAISTAQGNEEKYVANPSTKPVDSDSSTDVSSGAESFTTAPNSPCTPTPTEFIPLSLQQKECKLTTEPMVPPSPLPSPIKGGSPQQTSPADIKSDQSTAKQASPSKTRTPLKSAEADSSSVAGPLSTAHHSPAGSAPTKSPTVTSQPTSPLKVTCESDAAKTRAKSPATQTAATSPGMSAADSAVKTDSRLAPSSSPARPTTIAVESPAQSESHPAERGVRSATAPTSSVVSTQATTITDSSSSSVSSPVKALPTAVASPTGPRSPSDIKITETSSASASVNTADGLKCKETTVKSPLARTPAKINTDSHLPSISSPVKADPTSVASPEEPKSPSGITIIDTDSASAHINTGDCTDTTVTTPMAGTPATTNTDLRLPSISSPVQKAAPTAVASPAGPTSPSGIQTEETGSALAHVNADDGLQCKDTTAKSPLGHPPAKTNTDLRLPSISSPVKTDPPAVASPKEHRSPPGIKITQTSSASASVSTAGGLQCNDTTAKNPVVSTQATAITDSSSSSVSSPVKADATAVASPTGPRSPSNVTTKETDSVSGPVSPETGLPHRDTSASPAAVAVDTVSTTNASVSPVSSPTQTDPPANATSAGSSTSPVTKMSVTSPVSGLNLSKGTLCPPKQDSPVVEVSKEHSSLSNIPETSEADHTPNLAQSEGCSSPRAVPTSPCGVETVDLSPLQDPNKNDSSLPPTASATSVPPTNPVATTSGLPAGTPATDHDQAPQALSSPAVTVSGDSSDSKLASAAITVLGDSADSKLASAAVTVLGDSSDSKLASAELVLSTGDSGSSANTATSVANAATEGEGDSDAKDVPRAHASADAAKPSGECPSDDLSNATSHNTKDAVTSPSSEEHRSPAEEAARSPSSRYPSSTANVLSCSNLRDDTKVLLEQISANSQTRAAKQNLPATDDGKQNLPATDDAKEREEKAPSDKSNKLLASRFLGWESHITRNERERLITAMESKRKERRVYSRFEVS
ncbi:hypothetical protein ACEWY4_020656 [Coilia grayii]|uniref:Scaffolding anchor of CK1 domain-containing protein n=1 Tax=Coilia grayii TaxID=363190 RepID=A0ABD1J6Q6_9TELE